ncbi:MAG: isocitrate lyase/PEP mutase family protein [Dehalococcoidia bacterium]|nr:isocitrate lyase/PEP mutase family protein [Dehalococcoidia bacterium]
MKATTRLRRMLSSGHLVVAPFVLNAFHAKIAEATGFEAVYMTGSGTAAERGFADVGLITQTEMVQNARYIAGAVSVPVVSDADTGYGNPINVWRTVREYEDAGVAAIHIEDQLSPKKCGFFEGKEVIPQDEMVQKIRAALDARRDPDVTIIARSDAYAVTGGEDTVTRCQAYIHAGADMVFVDGIKTVEDLQAYAADLKDVPRMYNGDLLPTQEVDKMGYKLMICGATTWKVYLAVKDSFEELKTTGQINLDRWETRWDYPNLLGLEGIYEMEQRYGVSETPARL